MSSAVAECIVTAEGEENLTSIAGIHSYIYIYIFIAPLLFIGIEKTRVSRKEG